MDQPERVNYLSYTSDLDAVVQTACGGTNIDPERSATALELREVVPTGFANLYPPFVWVKQSVLRLVSLRACLKQWDVDDV